MFILILTINTLGFQKAVISNYIWYQYKGLKILHKFLNQTNKIKEWDWNLKTLWETLYAWFFCVVLEKGNKSFDS